MKAKTSKRTTAEAFDEWMRLYEENPERFNSSYAIIKKFLKEKRQRRKVTSYGNDCASILEILMNGGTI